MLRRIITSVTTRKPFFQFNAVRLKSTDEGQDGESPPPLVVEDQVHDALRKSFPKATYIQVEDMSGGCGAMFNVSIEAYEFKGMSIITQHRMVNEALKDLIKNMHGIKIFTTPPPEY